MLDPYFSSVSESCTYGTGKLSWALPEMKKNVLVAGILFTVNKSNSFLEVGQV